MKSLNENGPGKFGAYFLLFASMFLIGGLYATRDNKTDVVQEQEALPTFAVKCSITREYNAIVQVALLADVMPDEIDEIELVANVCNGLINNGTIIFKIDYEAVE